MNFLYILLTASVFTTVGGFTQVLANWDAATVGIVIAAFGTLISAIVAGVVAVLNTQSKNRIEHLRVQMELQKVQMEIQRELSLVGNRSLGALHQAMDLNTRETIKSTEAADQMKVRVEELKDIVKAAPAPHASEVVIVNPPSDPVNSKIVE